MELQHGGDWAGFQREYGKLPLDFSANVSPLGLPEGVRQAVVEALDMADRYPDPLCRDLRDTLAMQNGIPAAHILCGNGAADLIVRLVLARRPRKALVTAPAFLEYEQALALADGEVVYWPLKAEEDFAVTGEILSALTPDLDMVFLCEPNNPSGMTTEKRLLLKILQSCAEQQIVLAVDECFYGFLDEPEAHSLVGEVESHENLLVLRAFTKWYAMAGLRLGYCLCSSTELLEAMRTCGQPWPVSVPAQAAGLAALEEEGYSRRLRSLILRERPRLAEGLRHLGCRVVPGEANFLLFYHRADDLAARLRTRGILIRDCSNYRGLSRGWYRAAVRTGEENDVLLNTMGEVLSWPDA